MNAQRRTNPWIIVALLVVVSLLNYFDRQSLSVVAPHVQAQLHMSDQGYAHIVSLFLFASAVAFLFSGFVADAMGTRRSMAFFVALWSIAEVCTAFVTSATQLGVARFFLGIGEPGLWVAAPKAVSESLEKPHRSLAVGIYTAGATVGAIVAVPLVIMIESRYRWPAVFLLSGFAGLAWIPLWLKLYQANDAKAAPSAFPALGRLLRNGAMWRLMVARAMTDPVWFFYLFWYPKYLVSERHMSAGQLASLGWIVYLFAGVGTVAGGLISGSMVRRGVPPADSYRRSMAMSAVMVLAGPLAFYAHGVALSIAAASVVALAHMAWLINLTAVLLEIFPAEDLGKGAGMVAAGSALGGMVSSEIVGYCVSHGGYGPVFLLMICMHPMAYMLLRKAFRAARTYGTTPGIAEQLATSE